MTGTLRIHRTYRYRLKPTYEQQQRLFQWIGAVRWVYNAALDQRTWYGRSKNSDPDPFFRPETGFRDGRFNAFSQSKEVRVKSLKSDPELAWIADLPAQAIGEALADLDKAFDAFFQRIRNGEKPGYPRHRRFGQNESVRIPVYPGTPGPAKDRQIVLGRGGVKLPKLGWVRYKKHKNYRGKPTKATIVHQAGRWFIAVACEIEIAAPMPPLGPAVGLDLGVAKPITFSDGNVVGPDFGILKLDRRQRKLQRALSRCRKGSRRRQRRKAMLAKAHRRISERRRNRNHRITSEITTQYSVIIIENLRLRNMTAAAKGTAEAPGRNVKAKAGLNRAILNVAPFQIRAQLEYKINARGGRLITVDPAYTSQICSACQATDAASRKSQSVFECTACGFKTDADFNAARNILARGLMATAVGRQKTPSESHRAFRLTDGQRPATLNPDVFPSRARDTGQNPETKWPKPGGIPDD